MSNLEKFQSEKSSYREDAEHNKVLEGMFAEVGEEIVKILSVNNREEVATVQFGKGGDIEGVSFKKLRTLKISEHVTAEWESANGQDTSEAKLAA